jgi:signal transduction histidine kinase
VGEPVDNASFKILAVDDDEALRHSLARSLREAGYQVIEGKSGGEALELVKQAPDLITLDVDLPDIHAFEVCKKIKSDPATAHIPVLYVSSTYVEPNARVQGLASGADAYLAEPIDREEFVATVGALLRLKNAENTARQQAEIAEQARRELAQLNATLENRVSERTADLKMANEGLRELSVRVLQMQDDERRRIARELHDSVGQALTAIKLNNAVLQSDAKKLTAHASKALAENDALVEDVLKSIRTISHLLHPPLLDEAGLPSALRWYVGEFSQRSGIKVELDCASSLPRFSDEMETAIFRIVQESLGNIHRHSGSLTAAIHLSVEHGKVQLKIQDQGKGISSERRNSKTGVRAGVGIRGMRERAAQFGGHLEIDSSKRGTIITVVLPSQPALKADGERVS